MNECTNCSQEKWETGIACVYGDWYGFCNKTDCTGTCRFLGECECTCHEK